MYDATVMISSDDIKKLAGLARLGLTQAEQDVLAKEVDSILGYVEQIKEVSGKLDDNRAIPAHRNVMRSDDHPHESGVHTEDILKNAPDRDGNYLKVKKILGGQSA